MQNFKVCRLTSCELLASLRSVTNSASKQSPTPSPDSGVCRSHGHEGMLLRRSKPDKVDPDCRRGVQIPAASSTRNYNVAI